MFERRQKGDLTPDSRQKGGIDVADLGLVDKPLDAQLYVRTSTTGNRALLKFPQTTSANLSIQITIITEAIPHINKT